MLEVMQPEWEEKDMCMCVKTQQKCVPLGGVQRKCGGQSRQRNNTCKEDPEVRDTAPVSSVYSGKLQTKFCMTYIHFKRSS